MARPPAAAPRTRRSRSERSAQYATAGSSRPDRSAQQALWAQQQHRNEDAIDQDGAVTRRHQCDAVDLDHGEDHGAEDVAGEIAEAAENDDDKSGYGERKAHERRNLLRRAYQRAGE